MSRHETVWFRVTNEEEEYDTWLNEQYNIYHYQDKYLYDYQWYHEKFPEEWILKHRHGTGPGQCENCADYGTVNGIFIGYCANCAIHVYKGTRGRGFIGGGLEDSANDVIEYPSAFDTYLTGVDVLTIEPIDNDIENNNQNEIITNSYDEEEEDLGNVYYEDTDAIEDNSSTSILNCHFEGGYNDF
jgi:hypothetical protein